MVRRRRPTPRELTRLLNRRDGPRPLGEGLRSRRPGGGLPRAARARRRARPTAHDPLRAGDRTVDGYPAHDRATAARLPAA